MARAKAELKGRAARKAVESGVDAAQTAVGLKTAELMERLREADPVGRVSTAGTEAAERVSAAANEAAQKARTAGEEAAERASAAGEKAARRAKKKGTEEARRAKKKGDEAAEQANAKAEKAEAKAKAKAEQAGKRGQVPDERLPELVALLREAQQTRAVDVPKKRRRSPFLLFLLVAAGAAAAWWRRSQAQSEDDPYAQSAEWLAATPEPADEPPVSPPTGPAPSGMPTVPPDSSTTLSTADELTVDIEMPVVTGPIDAEPLSSEPAPFAPLSDPYEPTGSSVSTDASPLEDDIRTELDGDPRTAGLVDLVINVADSTVFVRGNVPAGFDPTAIRDVIAAVPGVTDVDMQVTYT